MDIPNNKLNSLILDLLVSTKIDVEVLKVMLTQKYLLHTSNSENDDENIKKVSEQFEENKIEVRKILLAQIQNRYGTLDDIDDILRSAFQ